MTAIADMRVDMPRLVEELRLIGHPIRLALLAVLARGERGVGDLAADTGQGPVLVSQQLALLRKAGLVHTRREAKQVFYRLADGRLAQVIASLSEIVGPVQVRPAPAPAAKPQARSISAAMFARIEPRL